MEQRYPWQTHRIPPAAFQPARDILLHVNLTDPLTIDTMVAYGANCHALCTRDPQAARLALRYTNVSIRQINKRLENEGNRPSPILLHAICGLICAILETTQSASHSDRQALDAHVRGLRILIDNSGGWRAIADRCFDLSWLIAW